MVKIIVGAIGAGKTSYMTSKLNDEAFNSFRRFRQKTEIERLKKLVGRNFTQPKSLIYSNYNFTAKKRASEAIKGIRFAPENVGLPSESSENIAFAPFSVLGIMEAQNYFNSRLWRDFGRGTGAFFEWSRHWGLDIYLDTQNFDLIDKTIREIAEIDFIEKREIFDERGKIINGFCRKRDFGKIRWTLRHYQNAYDFEANEFKRVVYETENNIFECYDERENKIAYIPQKGGFLC